MPELVRFAILGCGHIGKRHAELVQKHDESELVATIDIADADKLQILNFNAPHFKNLDDFLASELSVDVVNICTPNGLHASQAVACLNKGIHVIIEKPIALTTVDANAILAAAVASGKQVFPVVQNRYSPTVKWLKEIVSKGLLGKTFMVQLNCFWNRDDQYYTNGSWHGTLSLDGGPLYTQFSHFIDVLYWIFGDVENVQTRFSNFNHQHSTEFEDSGVVTFDLVGGGIGSINYSTSVYQSNFESSITVIAENGTVKIGGQYMNSIEHCHVKGAEKPMLSETQIMNNYGAYKGSASNHQFVIDNVIATLKREETPHVTLGEGIKVVNIISDIYRTRENRQQVIRSLKERQLT